MIDPEEIRITGKPDLELGVCRFFVNHPIYPGGTLNCNGPEEAGESKLFQALFEVAGVEKISASGNTITVKKKEESEWRSVGGEVAEIIRSFLASGTPLFPKPQDSPHDSAEALAIQRLLDEQINPAVAAHGGHVELKKVQGDSAFLEFSGGCQGCGMAAKTMKEGIEVAIKKEIPLIKNVFDVTEHQEGKNPYFKAQNP